MCYYQVSQYEQRVDGRKIEIHESKLKAIIKTLEIRALKFTGKTIEVILQPK